jgi:hypothetical protein
MPSYPPQASDFQAYFTREFVYGSGGDFVTANDINRALAEALPLVNQGLLDTLGEQITMYLYAAAHFLVMNIQGAGGLSAVPRGRGVRDNAEAVIVTKSVGQVSVTYQVPPTWIQNSMTLLPFFRTNFGQRYLQMIGPRVVGNAMVACGPNDVFQMDNE